ncbi:TatD family hydrolase [Hylemonella gracilis]|uniref:TatD-like protein deoxyribonuclease n=1 Tax=Hylemonella gracilis ATCC 19624 TaxID=887062 RepID=F3KXH3_9BURK|nr:TatD-like protein deoxyribonuclease [Hylemonella gracilis ATCC 19624]
MQILAFGKYFLGHSACGIIRAMTQPRDTFIDTHVHLDAPEFLQDVATVRARARDRGVTCCVLPAVQARDFERARALAHEFGDAYALGIHPLFVAAAEDQDLARLDQALTRHRDDPRLVAVGEIGLDLFVPALCEEPLRTRQLFFYREQLKLAKKHRLPVILHVRRSADLLLKGLRDLAGPGEAWHGIAHAFNGSLQQAQAFIDLGFKLGFGGALTYERATKLRELARVLPLEALVLETDAPDIPPHWLYTTAAQREQGLAQGRNEPGELPRIALVLAELRGVDLAHVARDTRANALAALPRLDALLGATGPALA